MDHATTATAGEADPGGPGAVEVVAVVVGTEDEVVEDSAAAGDEQRRWILSSFTHVSEFGRCVWIRREHG